MNKQQKTALIADLKEKFSECNFFYITDSSTLTVEKVNELRGLCFKNNIEMKVLKNTLVKKALEENAEEKGYAPLFDALKGPTAIMFTETANLPAKVIKEFRENNDKPILKAAYIDSDVFIGDDQVDTLAALKSKEDLLGEIVLLLQSPIKNVLGSLQSGGNTIAGLVKALQEREA